MNFLFAQSLLETLMLDARNGAMKILTVQLAVKLILSHHQLDIKKIINKPTHIGNNTSSCTDLIFCYNFNLLSSYGVDLSLFEKCHHNSIFGKVNIRIPHPPGYVCEVWDYGSANTKNIQKAVRNFDWKKAFRNLSVDRKADFRNYIPNKKIKFNYCQPLWINDNIKRCLKERSKLTKFFYNNGQKREDKEKLEAEAVYYKEQIMKAKNDYRQRMTNKLNAPKAAPKTHWSILNRFLYNKKIPAIPPLLRNGKFVSYFCAKSNLFNEFFASICTPINHGSTIPPFAYKTNVRINSFRINHNDISLIIKNIDSNKAHGCDKIPMKMIQICGVNLLLCLLSYYLKQH